MRIASSEAAKLIRALRWFRLSLRKRGGVPRAVKWLSEITVTTEESDNFFHFNDNRVLPEHVTAEIANAEGWWYKPDYIINELNINSAIHTPNHLEVVRITRPGQTYTVKGYCYNGGGRKVRSTCAHSSTHLAWAPLGPEAVRHMAAGDPRRGVTRWRQDLDADEADAPREAD